MACLLRGDNRQSFLDALQQHCVNTDSEWRPAVSAQDVNKVSEIIVSNLSHASKTFTATSVQPGRLVALRLERRSLFAV